jgi:hypothetical protein
MKVRMLRHVTAYVQVRDLEMGQVYDINDDRAEQFIANGMAESIEKDGPVMLEAAALREPRRRG